MGSFKSYNVELQTYRYNEIMSLIYFCLLCPVNSHLYIVIAKSSGFLGGFSDFPLHLHWFEWLCVYRLNHLVPLNNSEGMQPATLFCTTHTKVTHN